MATSQRIRIYSVLITELGLPGLTYSGQCAAYTSTEARMLVVRELRRYGVVVPRGAIVRCSASQASPATSGRMSPLRVVRP